MDGRRLHITPAMWDPSCVLQMPSVHLLTSCDNIISRTLFRPWNWWRPSGQLAALWFCFQHKHCDSHQPTHRVLLSNRHAPWQPFSAVPDNGSCMTACSSHLRLPTASGIVRLRLCVSPATAWLLAIQTAQGNVSRSAASRIQPCIATVSCIRLSSLQPLIRLFQQQEDRVTSKTPHGANSIR